MSGGASGYGGGVDSTAMLVGLKSAWDTARPDLDGDPGSEKTPTYQFSGQRPN
jgi:hypothetical protein